MDLGIAGKVALVTASSRGLGRATALALAGEGVQVMLSGRDAASLAATRDEIAALGIDVGARAGDVTDPGEPARLVGATVEQFGRLDILVANAGLASSAPIEETTVELWRKNYDVLAEGYFLSSRAAFPLMRRQKGGAIVFIGSKNALAATPNASAYASAKAAALHLARCLALEGAEHGIRVNVVNPDAVIRGSRIWDGDWRQERANAYGIDAGEELEEFYRQRSLLKRTVLPEDIAEAVCFLASDAASKSTGNILNVDAGNAQAFTR